MGAQVSNCLIIHLENLRGEVYNLTAFNMCAHNGTHIDAPFHFIKNGKTVDEVCLEAFVGMAYVAEHHGIVTGDDAVVIIEKAKKQNPEATKRLLIKGDSICKQKRFIPYGIDILYRYGIIRKKQEGFI